MEAKDSKNAYREERKERLAKNAKKKNQKSHDATFVVTIVLWVLGIALVLAMTCGILWAYGVPQSVLTVEKIGDRSYSMADFNYYYMSVFQTNANQSYQTQSTYGISLGFDYTKSPDAQTTTDSDGNTITYAEKFKQDTISQLEEMNYYLNLAKEEGVELSEETKAEIEEEISSYAEQASSNGYSTSRYLSVMFGKGVTLKKFRGYLEEQHLVEQYRNDKSENLSKSITNEQIDAEYEKSPQEYQQVNIRLFGLEISKDEAETAEAVTEEATAAAEKTAEETETAEAETEAPETETEAAETESETPETTTEAPAQEAAADSSTPSAQETLLRQMLARITDEQSFIELAKEYCNEEDKASYEEETATLLKGVTKSAVSSNIDEDFAEWLFSTDRKTGDKNLIATDSMVYVVYIIDPAYRNETPLVSVRHILISYDNIAADLGETKDAEDLKIETKTAEDGTEITNEGTGYSIDVAMQTYEKALSVLNDYNAGEKTEEAFAALADQESADTASVGEDAENGGGGLYEKVQQGQMVAEFDNWIYDESREPGEVGMVKTTYGWHIIYFISREDEPSYKSTIRTALVNAQNEEDEKKAKEACEGSAVGNAKLENFAVKEAVKQINKLYVSSSSES